MDIFNVVGLILIGGGYLGIARAERALWVSEHEFTHAVLPFVALVLSGLFLQLWSLSAVVLRCLDGG